MGKGSQSFIIVFVSILMLMIAYLYDLPHSDGIEEKSRLRLLNASMKIIRFFAYLSDLVGFAPRWQIQRDCAILLLKLRSKEIDDELHIEDKHIEGIPVRIYSPLSEFEKKTNESLPVVLYFHGGAFYRGSIETHHPMTRLLALQTRFVIVSVEYRLSPEYPYPNGLNDCFQITNHFLNLNSDNNYQIDPTRLALAGDSAGGNFVAAIITKLLVQSEPRRLPRALILIYPVVQFFDLMLPSYQDSIFEIFDSAKSPLMLQLYLNRSLTDRIFVNAHTNREQKHFYRRWVNWQWIPAKYRQTYREPLNDDDKGDEELIENAQIMLNEEISPLLVEDEILSEYPMTYLLSVGQDRLRDENFIFAHRLKMNGVDLIHEHFENTFHGSLTFLDGLFRLNVAHQMMRNISNYLLDHL